MAIHLEPDNVKAHNNLGVAYHNQGRFDDAIKEYQTAINLRPDYPGANNNLKLLYQEKRLLDDVSRTTKQR